MPSQRERESKRATTRTRYIRTRRPQKSPPEIARTIAGLRGKITPTFAAPGGSSFSDTALARRRSRAATEIAGTDLAWKTDDWEETQCHPLVAGAHRRACATPCLHHSISGCFRPCPAALANAANHHFTFNIAGGAATEHKSGQRCSGRRPARAATLVEDSECSVLRNEFKCPD